MPLRQKGTGLKAVDFFCGAGGVTCGFSQAGIDVLAGIDINPSFKETYEKNNNSKFINADISSFTPEELIKETSINTNDDNLIFIGCSPCQYYTNLKTDKTKSKKSRLLLEDFQDFVDYFKPGYIFIENVPGLTRLSESPLVKFKTFLDKNDYIFDDERINAKFYGVPQNRRRYVLIASRVQTNIEIPEEDRNNIKTVKDAIGNYSTFPVIESGHSDSTPFLHTVGELSPLNLKRIRKTPKDGGSRKAWAEIQELQLKCYKDHDGHWDVYGRMRWNTPSPTITTRFRSITNGRYGHPEQDRGISIREGATLQTFPLDYHFYSDAKEEISKMIGNAVPPELARRIGLRFVQAHNVS